MESDNRITTNETGGSLREVCARTTIALIEKQKPQIALAYNNLIDICEQIDFENMKFDERQFAFLNGYSKGFSDALELIISGKLDINLIRKKL